MAAVNQISKQMTSTAEIGGAHLSANINRTRFSKKRENDEGPSDAREVRMCRPTSRRCLCEEHCSVRTLTVHSQALFAGAWPFTGHRAANRSRSNEVASVRPAITGNEGASAVG